MKVSVVIRSRNEEVTIAQLLEKLKSQTFKDFEIVLVDNSSIDRTVETAKEYGVNKIINVPKEKFSHPYTENIGVSESQGELVVLINAHVLPYTDTWLGDGIRNFEDEKVAGISGYYTSDEVADRTNWIRKESDHMTTTNAIIRKDLWEMYKFDETLVQCEDYDWALEMISRGYKIIKDPKFSVRHFHIISDETRQEWARINKIIEGRKRPSI